MHALYSNHIGYNETPTLTVLNGPPSWVVRSTSKNGRSEARYRQCTKPVSMLGFIGPPAKRHFAVRWWADDGPLYVIFGTSLSLSARKKEKGTTLSEYYHL